jgi:hypothetical protein
MEVSEQAFIPNEIVEKSYEEVTKGWWNWSAFKLAVFVNLALNFLSHYHHWCTSLILQLKNRLAFLVYTKK